MNLLDLKCTSLPGPLINFDTREYVYTTVGKFIEHAEEYRDFVLVDEHIADVVMRCNSHGIRTYYSCAGHALDMPIGDAYQGVAFDGYIAFERKPVLRQMFTNSRYWKIEESTVEFDRYPSYCIYMKNCDDFKAWAKAIKELRHRFSHLTNEFRQLPSY